MTKNLEVSDSWPYVTDQHKSESKEHVQMKNLAIEWLLGFGFETNDIKLEHTVYSSNSYGYTDVYASRDEVEVFVECERGAPIKGNLSAGGSIPAKKGELVYFLNEEVLYRVRYTTVTATKKYGPFGVYETSEEHEFQTYEFDRLGPVPSRDEDYKFSSEAQQREREKVDWL
ncbi:hypothetical protein [Natronosalvus rutilus]|uniref:Uncharacterized protein n=1 Tax=Natronosalvus rutilus TaxID=2953753 RepID=A0A9E7N9D2_9EURY|nr:hypothetical protein [Natronosalvus rutilus]UTF52773.1 hypothetical protein NGM29_13400 [Natronosalvus rutilus]